MLILSRKKNQSIYLKTSDETIRLTITEIKGSQTKVGIDASVSVCILREEIVGLSKKITKEDVAHFKPLDGKYECGLCKGRGFNTDRALDSLPYDSPCDYCNGKGYLNG